MVIMSRSQDKLQKVANEISELAVSSCSFVLLTSSLSALSSCLLTPTHPSHPSIPLPEEKYGCEVRIIPVDFSDGQEIYPRIAEELQDLDIGVLGKVPSSTNSSSHWPCCVAGLTPHFACVFSKQCWI